MSVLYTCGCLWRPEDVGSLGAGVNRQVSYLKWVLRTKLESSGRAASAFNH